jgi:hypothetical protein
MDDQLENKFPDSIDVNLTKTNKIIGLMAYKGAVDLDMDIDLLRNRRNRIAYDAFNKPFTD